MLEECNITEVTTILQFWIFERDCSFVKISTLEWEKQSDLQ